MSAVREERGERRLTCPLEVQSLHHLPPPSPAPAKWIFTLNPTQTLCAIPLDFTWQQCSFWNGAWSRTDQLRSKVNYSCEQNIWTIAMAKGTGIASCYCCQLSPGCTMNPLSPSLTRAGQEELCSLCFFLTNHCWADKSHGPGTDCSSGSEIEPIPCLHSDCWKCALRWPVMPFLSSNASWMSLLSPSGMNAGRLKPQFWPLVAPGSSWTGLSKERGTGQARLEA